MRNRLPGPPPQIKGCKRFLERVAGLSELVKGSGATEKLDSSFHKTVKKVTLDIEEMKFNIRNRCYDVTSQRDLRFRLSYRRRIQDLCPHSLSVCASPVRRALESVGGEGFASLAKWPEYDDAKTVDDTVEIAVQICGKVKSVITISKSAEKMMYWRPQKPMKDRFCDRR